MAVAISRAAPLALRWQGPRVVTVTAQKGFVCGQCKRQRQRRSFHQTATRREKDDNKIDSNEGGKSTLSFSDLLSEEMRGLNLAMGEKEVMDLRRKFDRLSPEDRELYREALSQEVFEGLTQKLPADVKEEVQQSSKDATLSPEAIARLNSSMNRDVQRAVADFERDKPLMPQTKPRRHKMSFWDHGEEENSNFRGNTDVYKGDDLNELGHAELEHHRELREYARIAVWEMPLLSKLAKPFKPPDPTHMLRFRYTTYMGEEHPAAKKIVLEFDPSDLPDLTEAQRNKLIKLAGPRYNPETNIIKMSSEMFETQAQNKRYLGDLVETLMAEAKDETDMFEDVPFDFRHHKPKKRIEFPQDWVLTPERKMLLEQERQAIQQKETQKMIAGGVVDGEKIYQMAMAAAPAAGGRSRLMAEQQQRGGKKGGAGQKVLR